MNTLMWRPPPRTLEDVRDPDSDAPSLYPLRVLEGAETGLCLFCAAFWGRQDAYWMAEAGMRVTCVDLDDSKLGEMALVYPPAWEFVCSDAFQWIPLGDYDVVSLDPFTNLFDRCHEALPLWCSLARKAVVIGCHTDQKLEAPDGWKETERVHRSEYDGGIDWAVLEPA